MNTRSLSLFAAFIAALLISAQNKQISLGADLAMPQGDFSKEFSLGAGPTVGFELPAGKHFGITAQAGYSILLLKDEETKEVLDGASMIPLQLGFKYYPLESQHGPYLHAQAGMHMFTEKFKERPTFGIEAETETSSNFSYGIGAGYQLKKLDLGLRFNGFAKKEEGGDEEEFKSFSYIGLRVTYLINL